MTNPCEAISASPSPAAQRLRSTSTGSDDTDTAIRLIDVLIRFFFVSKLIPNDNVGITWIRAPWKAPCDIPRLRDDFVIFVQTCGPFHRDYARLWTNTLDSATWKLTLAQFDLYAPRILEYLPLIWNTIVSIVEEYLDDSVVPGRVSDIVSEMEFEDLVEKSFTLGSPVLRSMIYSKGWLDRIGSGYKNQSPLDPCLDALCTIATLLRKYILTITDAEGKLIHLCRDKSPERIADYSTNDVDGRKRQWYTFQVESGRDGLVCPVPNARKRRLQKQAVILKTCWDISSTFRARRLWVLLQMNSGIRDMPGDRAL